MSRENRPITAIPYFGGKTPHLPFLYANFVEDVHLVDCMCGSATTAINADPRKYPLITINDINSDVINFFYVLREHLGEFLYKLQFTPFSREEFYAASDPCDDKIEWARRYYVRALQGYSGQGSQNIDKHSWGYECAVVHKYNGNNRSHFRVTTWNSKLTYLHEIAAKLRNMQIEHRHVNEMFDIYGRLNTLLYLDPPYLMETRSDKKRYKFEFRNEDHESLLLKAVDCTCYCAISGYDSKFYDDILLSSDKSKWCKIYANPKKTNTSKKSTTECLWINYEQPKKKLFLF